MSARLTSHTLPLGQPTAAPASSLLPAAELIAERKRVAEQKLQLAHQLRTTNNPIHISPTHNQAPTTATSDHTTAGTTAALPPLLGPAPQVSHPMEDITTEELAVQAVQSAATAAAIRSPAIAPAATGPPRTTSATLPSTFLAMAETKLQYSESFALYVAQQHALEAAKTDLEEFDATCTKNTPIISLPLSIRPRFSHAHFLTVEDDAAFNKEAKFALKELEQEAAKLAYQCIVKGKKKFIDHFQGLVKVEGFIARASTKYATFIHTTNQSYADCGSSVVIPVQAALAHFDAHLRKEMESFVTQKVQSGFTAARKRTTTVEEEKEAEERVITGAHDGENINQIATKAVEKKLIETNKNLTAMNTLLSESITSLQQQVNELAHGQTVSAASEKAKAQKRKADQLSTKVHKVVEHAPTTITASAATTSTDSDIQMRDDLPPRKSNYRGGGRHQHTNNMKKKPRHGDGGREGEGTAAIQPNLRQ
jgi:hypothetical protein